MARVLVVDDDADLLKLVDLQLRQYGHRVFTAASGQQALDLVAEEGVPDVAILDIAIRDMGGYELLRRLRACEGGATLPTVFLTAGAKSKDAKGGRTPDAVWMKRPYEMNALLAAIDRLVVGVAQGW